MNAIFKREFKSYFTNLSGCLFIGVLLLFTGIFVTSVNLLNQYAAFEYAIENVIIVFLLIVPLLTMRSIAEEKHSRTDTLLYSLPLKLSSVVLGKYFAMLAVFLIPIILMAFYPVILSAFGTVSYLNAYASLFGFLLLGAWHAAPLLRDPAATPPQDIVAAAMWLIIGFAAWALALNFGRQRFWTRRR